MKAKREIIHDLQPMKRLADDIFGHLRAGDEDIHALTLEDAEASDWKAGQGDDKTLKLRKAGVVMDQGSLDFLKKHHGDGGEPKTPASKPSVQEMMKQTVEKTRKAAQNAASPQAQAGEDGGGQGSTKVDDEKSTTPSAVPRIWTLPPEQLAPLITPDKPSEISKPSKKSYEDAQQTFGNVWTKLNATERPGGADKDTTRLSNDLHNYFQLAAWNMSHDVPLLKAPQSRITLHQSMNRHIEALHPTKFGGH